jgi:hypothetical protein
MKLEGFYLWDEWLCLRKCCMLCVVSCCSGTDSIPTKGSAAPPIPYLTLPRRCKEKLLSGVCYAAPLNGKDHFLPFLLTDPLHSDAVIELCVHWSWANELASKQLLQMTLDNLNAETTGTGLYRPGFRLLSALLQIADAPSTAAAATTTTTAAATAPASPAPASAGDKKTPGPAAQQTLPMIRVAFAMPKLFALVNRISTRKSMGDERFLMYACKHILMLSYKNEVCVCERALLLSAAVISD